MRNKSGINYTKQYADFLWAGREQGVWKVAGSYLAATFVLWLPLATAGSVYTRLQLIVIAGAFLATLLLFGLVIVPLYHRHNLNSSPQLFERFGGGFARSYLGWVLTLNYTIVRIVILYFIGIRVIESYFLIDIMPLLITAVILAGFISILGGQSTILKIDILSPVLIVIALMTGTFLMAKGGSGVVGYPANSTAQPAITSILPAETGLTELLLGLPVLFFAMLVTDQLMAQKIIAGKEIGHSRNGVFAGGIAKITLLAVFLLATMKGTGGNQNGVMSFAELPGYVDSMTLLPKLVMISGFLAAMMSAFASTYNGFASLATIEYYGRRGNDISEQKLVLVGRLATAAIACFTVVLLPFVFYFGEPLVKIVSYTYVLFLTPLAAFPLARLFKSPVSNAGLSIALILVLAAGSIFLIRLFAGGPEAVNYSTDFSISPLSFGFLLFALSTVLVAGFGLLARAKRIRTIQGMGILK